MLHEHLCIPWCARETSMQTKQRQSGLYLYRAFISYWYYNSTSMDPHPMGNLRGWPPIQFLVSAKTGYHSPCPCHPPNLISRAASFRVHKWCYSAFPLRFSTEPQYNIHLVNLFKQPHGSLNVHSSFLSIITRTVGMCARRYHNGPQNPYLSTTAYSENCTTKFLYVILWFTGNPSLRTTKYVQ